jgi:hypothetical protein
MSVCTPWTTSFWSSSKTALSTICWVAFTAPMTEWAEHGADRKTVPYTVTDDMDAPNPDSGEEYFHTNTQLFNTLDEHNRFKIGEAVKAPWNAEMS